MVCVFVYARPSRWRGKLSPFSAGYERTDAMTMRDKIAVIRYFGTTIGHGVADAILAALPGMIPDLVWNRMEIKQNCAPGLWEQCYTPLGLYEIHTFTGKGGTFYLKTPDYGRASEHEYHTAARDTANAHHRAVIAKAAGWTAPAVASDKGDA
jgi:hypothetical protein